LLTGPRSTGKVREPEESLANSRSKTLSRIEREPPRSGEMNCVGNTRRADWNLKTGWVGERKNTRSERSRRNSRTNAARDKPNPSRTKSRTSQCGRCEKCRLLLRGSLRIAKMKLEGVRLRGRIGRRQEGRGSTGGAPETWPFRNMNGQGTAC